MMIDVYDKASKGKLVSYFVKSGIISQLCGVALTRSRSDPSRGSLRMDLYDMTAAELKEQALAALYTLDRVHEPTRTRKHAIHTHTNCLHYMVFDLMCSQVLLRSRYTPQSYSVHTLSLHSKELAPEQFQAIASDTELIITRCMQRLA